MRHTRRVVVTGAALPPLMPGTEQPSLFHSSLPLGRLRTPSLTHAPSLAKTNPIPSVPASPREAPWCRMVTAHLISLGSAGHKFLLLCNGAGQGREHLAGCPSAQEAAPRVTRSSQFVALENFCCSPSWALEMSQGPSMPPWDSKTGRHREGALRALLSSWQFVLLSLFFPFGGTF